MPVAVLAPHALAVDGHLLVDRVLELNAEVVQGQVSVGTFAGAGSPVAVTFHFAFTASNTTTFKLQFGNLVAAGGVVSRMMKGSYIRYKQIN
jgi:hypothetical protein